MAKFLGIFILTVLVVLLGHPNFVIPPFAITPLLFILIPFVSFYATVPPAEAELCPARDRKQTGVPQNARRYPLQL